MNYREEIGSELQTLRVQKGLTVRELAEASGVHYSNIAKIENGKYNVSVDILGKVADALGCKLAFEKKSIDAQRKLHGSMTLGELRRIISGRANISAKRDGYILTEDCTDDDIVIDIRVNQKKQEVADILIIVESK